MHATLLYFAERDYKRPEPRQRRFGVSLSRLSRCWFLESSGSFNGSMEKKSFGGGQRGVFDLVQHWIDMDRAHAKAKVLFIPSSDCDRARGPWGEN